MSEIYVVVNHDKVVGASHRLQGAEEIRADEAIRLANTIVGSDGNHAPRWDNEYRIAYGLMTIHNTNLQDDAE